MAISPCRLRVLIAAAAAAAVGKPVRIVSVQQAGVSNRWRLKGGPGMTRRRAAVRPSKPKRRARKAKEGEAAS